jgi:hypothetical protein
MTAPVIVVEERDGLLRLLDALRHPETVEEYEPVDLDGSDTSMETQLNDAGFGSAGII